MHLISGFKDWYMFIFVLSKKVLRLMCALLTVLFASKLEERMLKGEFSSQKIGCVLEVAIKDQLIFVSRSPGRMVATIFGAWVHQSGQLGSYKGTLVSEEVTLGWLARVRNSLHQAGQLERLKQGDQLISELINTRATFLQQSRERYI